MIKTFWALASATCGLALASGSATADTWCGGTVKAILTTGSGQILVIPTFRNDWIMVCSISGVWKGVTVDVCKSWVATLTALRLTQEPLAVYYNETFTCSSIPTYSDAYAPGYVSISVN